MKKTKRRVIAAAALGVLASVLIPGTASATTEVPCGSRTDFAKLFIGAGKRDRCFANDGELWATFYPVTRVCSGNNWLQVYGDLDRATGQEARTLRPWTCVDTSPWGPYGTGARISRIWLYR